MRKLSFWAKQNPWKARIIIIISHILLTILALFTGRQLLSLGMGIPAWLLYLFALIFITVVFIYPSKHVWAGCRTAFYIKQKVCDFALAAATFLMFLVLGNNQGEVTQLFSASLASVVTVPAVKEKPTAAEILESLKHRDKSTLTRTEKRILKQEFKKQLKVYAVSTLKGDKDAAGQAGLIILAVIAAVGLLYVVAAISCNLSCNGSEGGAAVVALLGTAAVVLGLILVIRAISRKNRRKRETQAPDGQ